MTKFTHEKMREILDALERGDQIKEACIACGVSEPGLWTAKRQSRIDESELDYSRFWFDWNGHENFFHTLLDVATEGHTGRGHPKKRTFEEWDPGDEPLPPYHRSLRTPAKAEFNPQQPFPPPVTEASPRARVRPDSALVRDLVARAALTPTNPVPLDANGRRTIISNNGMRADDPPENVTRSQS
jgi:hypothetical protein